MIERMKKSRAGFTLAELIVVIAILGILAGISIPVYSGYISKAAETSDLQLLAALNTAYAAACVDSGVNPLEVVGLATLAGEKGSKTVSAVSAVGTGVSADQAARLNDSFFLLYGDNKDTAFKTFTSLGYDTANGVFVDGAKTISMPYNGKTISVTYSDVTAFDASTFGSVGVQDLMDEVAKVSGLASSGGSLTGASVLQHKDDEGGTSPLVYKFLSDKLNFSDDQISKLSQSEISNALVLMSASELKGLDASFEDILDGTFDMSDYSDVSVGALLYAVGMGFANSSYATAEQKTAFNNSEINEIDDVFGSLVGLMYVEDSEEEFNEQFQSYLKNQVETDMSGFISTMNMIDSNIENLDTAELLKNGYSDPQLVGFLKQILG